MLRWNSLLILFFFAAATDTLAQQHTPPHTAATAAGPLVNTSQSPHAILESTGLAEVHWTKGFWADRFEVAHDSMLPRLWRIYTDKNISHAFENFEIAAGIDTGTHAGPPFHDGDFYKLLEAMAATYAVTKDRRLDQLMDSVIAVIAKCQRHDGYIHTPTTIEEKNHPGKNVAFEDRLNFETYNMGHLMTAACIHYRATGKRNFLVLAIRAADYLDAFYHRSSPELARNAICPSHYMGIIELYRTTGNPKYLQLANNLINIRGLVDNGTDDNQDRIPFRSQYTAMGHAVRANYLYAGVADIVAETGDDSLATCLNSIWTDLTDRKLYITGGCGALYDGVSPDATSYAPPQIQEVHQAYGRDYQLPNTTAHNETCANIGNVLFNWRMLLLTGDARYTDVIEQCLYNSVLSGVSLDGARYFYTNPLRSSRANPFTLRWAGGRQEYISLSNCCPPNLARTIAEVSDYVYSLSAKGLWVNLYSGSQLSTHLPGSRQALKITQETDYPWDGQIAINIDAAPDSAFSIFLRIPGWCNHPTLTVNGQSVETTLASGTYAPIHRHWKKGDRIILNLPMTAALVQANPLVEETRGQVAVRRGPVVYCLESPDLPASDSLFDISLSASVKLQPNEARIKGSRLFTLTGTANLESAPTSGPLYRPLSDMERKPVTITLIPYYAWANRGPSDMTVWLPLAPQL